MRWEQGVGHHTARRNWNRSDEGLADPKLWTSNTSTFGHAGMPDVFAVGVLSDARRPGRYSGALKEYFIVSHKALDDARECFKEKEVPQALQHILSKAAASVDALVVDVSQWGEASVKAMLRTCVDSVATIPEVFDPDKPKQPQSAMQLYLESHDYAKHWSDLSAEERKEWECQAEALHKSFPDRTQAWKERREVQAKHLKKVLEIFDRRIAQGLVKTDIAILMRMLVGSPAQGGVRAYFARDEKMITRKPARPSTDEGEYTWKYWKYSLRRGFESLGSVAVAIIAAHPDFWTVFVFDLVAGLPAPVKAKCRKNIDGSFAFTKVGIQLEPGFRERVEKMLEALVDLGVRLMKENKFQAVQLTTGLAVLIFSIDDDDEVPFWLRSAFGKVAAAVDVGARAILVETLVLPQLPPAVENCWERTIGSSLHLPSELPRLRTLRRSKPEKVKVTLVEQMTRSVEVFALFAAEGKQQICKLLMDAGEDCDSFLCWASCSMLQAMD